MRGSKNFGCRSERVASRSSMVVLVLALALAGGALGCRTAALLQPPPLVGTGSVQENKAAILRGMAKRGWELAGEQPGAIVARIDRRKHMAEVTIRYTADEITIRYKDSDGLKCDPMGDSCSSIHRNYNSWVLRLRQDIASEIDLVKGGA